MNNSMMSAEIASPMPLVIVPINARFRPGA
jgi:hypothetical protein